MGYPWARYLGRGYVPGIPARDLTADEVVEYGEEGLRRSGIYEIVTAEAAEEDSDGI